MVSAQIESSMQHHLLLMKLGFAEGSQVRDGNRGLWKVEGRNARLHKGADRSPKRGS